MSVDFSIKPVGAVVAAPAPVPVPPAAHTAVATQLPPSNAVVAASVPAAAQNDAQSAIVRRSDQIVIDRDAAEVVYRTVDSFTHVVVSQFPDEAILRARAYGRALDIARQEQSQKGTTDRTI
jgi:allantoicase